MQFFDIDVGQRLKIGAAVVSLIEKRGRKARLSVHAPREIPVNLERDARKPPEQRRETR